MRPRFATSVAARALVLGFLAGTALLQAQPPAITEFPLPTSGSRAGRIVAGPDGNLWFTIWYEGALGNAIGRITPSGSATEFPIPSGYVGLDGLVAGADGNIWFTESAANKVGRMTPAGIVTEFSVPSPRALLSTIVRGPDGNVWFVEGGVGKMGRATPDGVITEFPFSFSTSFIGDIAVGSDGNIWFTEAFDFLGRMTIDGSLTEYSIGSGTILHGIGGLGSGTQGPLWFTQGLYPSAVGKVSTAGVVTQRILTPTANSYPHVITVDSRGDAWFTYLWLPRIGRVAHDSTNATEIPLPDPHGDAAGIVEGPDGAIWFTEPVLDRVGRLDPALLPPPVSVPVLGEGMLVSLAALLALGGAFAVRKL